AEKLLNLIPTDVGRSITDLNLSIKIPDLGKVVGEVVESLATREMELQDGHGRWFSVRFRPYKTVENRIDGAVISFVDIDPIRRNMEKLQEYANDAPSIAEAFPEPVLVLGSDLTIHGANQAFYTLFKTRADDLLGQGLQELGDGGWQN